MHTSTSLNSIVDPVISLVSRAELRYTLRRAFSAEQAAVQNIEEFFGMLPIIGMVARPAVHSRRFLANMSAAARSQTPQMRIERLKM